MSFKSLKNLALAAALAVSAAGLFPDSALARRARYSGISDGGDAEFFIDSKACSCCFFIYFLEHADSKTIIVITNLVEQGIKIKPFLI